ncbi:hypothetical protein JJJ17_06460 [Paracoccus caeni]|uniref:Uncharacterized protein n=1 Tax=Paracoccus caeni TaxID=657651 RepID=A0A934W087_9RHOB|nr:hypothetical protein [Paracoccus caeni]MBK4215564.1 hypothetical protein [Paracoccus caeni]
MQAKAEESWEKFETEIRTNDYQTVIVSSEDIPAARLRDEMMERFKKSFDKITGIFYFRDPVDLYVSDLNQRIRHGLRLRHSPTPLDYDYRHLEFADWFSAHVGTDSLISRNFDRSNLVDGNAVADFFDIITRLCGLNEQFDLPSAPVNQSLPGVATVWLYTFNEILDRRIRNISANILERRSEIVRQLRQSQIVNEHENLSLKDPQLQSLIRQRAAEDLKTINEKYLVGQVPLATDDNPPVTMTNEQARERMREWFLGYMQPDAVSAISRELLG